MTTENKIADVYAESTPNPKSMKFVASRWLLAEGIAEYRSKKEAHNCPLAYRLFEFTGVEAVFITSNFVTVTKKDDIEWFEITNILREFIRAFLNSGEKLFLKNPSGNNSEDVSENNAAPDHAVAGNETEEKIISMLDEYIRPAVEQDGGAIHFKSFEEGVVTLSLRGSCSGCPSSTVTLKAGIENLLKKMIPEVKEVIADAE